MTVILLLLLIVITSITMIAEHIADKRYREINDMLIKKIKHNLR